MINIEIPLIRCRNFDSHEIARGAKVVPPIQAYLTFYAMGVAQMVRDAASHYFGDRFHGLGINSSNRVSYNDKVPRAAHNSHHIYRVDPDTLQLHCALDLKPLGVSPREFYDFLRARFKGEIILEESRGIVHYAPVAMDTEAFEQ